MVWPEVPKPKLSEEFLKKVSSLSFSIPSTVCEELIHIHLIPLIPNTVSQNIFGVFGKFTAVSRQVSSSVLGKIQAIMKKKTF